MAKTHYRTCNLCEAMCGLKIEVEGERVTSIRGDEDDLFSKGYLCPKAIALQDLHEDPDRLRQPMRRVGDRWEAIGWDEALNEVADRLHAIQKEHGNNAVGLYVGNPNVHNLSNLFFGPLLLRGLRSKSRFSATSLDQLPHMLAAYLMWGHQLMLGIPDIDRTQHMLILGANPLASNGSLMTAPGMRDRLKALQARGGAVVVIDPRRTETAKVADRHEFIRPGTDAFFLLGMLSVIFEIGLKLGRLSNHIEGLDTLRNLVRGFSVEQCANICGIEASKIENITRTFLAADKVVCYGRMGTSTQEFGGVCTWLINCINLVSGNFDSPGGVMFTKPAVDTLTEVAGMGIDAGSFGRWKSRVRGLPEFGGELPASVLAEEILTPGEGQILAMVVAAGNPVLSVQNGGQMDRAFESLEFFVSLDMYITETSRHANIILPPISPLERSHYDLAFHILAVRNTAKFSPAIFKKPRGSRSDGEIMLDILMRIEKRRNGSLNKRFLTARALRVLGVERLLDIGLRAGPYTKSHKLSLSKLKKHPHGIDFGALQPAVPERVPRGRDKIDLAPQLFVDDIDRLIARHVEGYSLDESKLVLIGRRNLRNNNSWMHNSARLMKGKDRCTLLMHPTDAARMKLVDDQKVEIESRVGKVIAPLEITDDMMPGVVSLPHGFGHGRPGVKLRVAQEHPGVSINDLTDDALVDTMSGNAAFI